MPKKKKQTTDTTGNKSAKEPGAERPQRGFVIRFPDEKAHRRAVMILGEVPLPFVGVPDKKCGIAYGVMRQHIELLQKEEIPYEEV